MVRAAQERMPVRPASDEPAAPRNRPIPAARALPAQGHRAVPRLSGRHGHRAPRRAALCAAGARRSARRQLLLAAVPGGARAPRAWPTRSSPSPTSTADAGRSACMSARGRRTSRRRCSRSPPSSSASSSDPASEEELDRSRENLKGRVVLSLESTGARMSRLGASMLGELPILSSTRCSSGSTPSTSTDQASWPPSCSPAERLSVAGVGPDERAFADALEHRSSRPTGRRHDPVAVAGAAGRMGKTVCAAVEGAADMELVGRADPLLGVTLAAGAHAGAPRGGRRLHASGHRAGERSGMRARGRARRDRDHRL